MPTMASAGIFTYSIVVCTSFFIIISHKNYNNPEQFFTISLQRI
jgi:hypothetical protein